jgi:hypothetical protein
MKGRFKNSISDDINNLIGTQGIKTDVTVDFDTTTVIILLFIIPVTVAGGILLADVLRKVFKM